MIRFERGDRVVAGTSNGVYVGVVTSVEDDPWAEAEQVAECRSFEVVVRPGGTLQLADGGRMHDVFDVEVDRDGEGGGSDTA